MVELIGLSMTAFSGKSIKDFEEWAGKTQKLGFDFIELLSEWPHYLTKASYRDFAEIVEGYGMKITVHAPFSDINIGAFNEKIRRAALEVLHETIEVAAEMNALVVTIHPGHRSPLSIKHQEKYLEIHRKSLRKIAAWSEEFGIKVGLENMPSFPILDAQSCERLAELVGDIDIGVTLDVGHLNTTTRNFDRFIQLLGNRIMHLHLHDNRGDKDEHLPLGEGTVPWAQVIPKLPKVTWSLEVGDIESARKSLEFLRSLH
ncbi:MULTISPECIES: sugar phosphate isomerase/epimerase family protein [unclassified Thermococcus]|uniref:sugar phosphate isomerase/epimerase family protein n=1 Tax=unclassified Thermococcus TaxID=2627626 RepID=UPI003182E800